MKLSIVIPAYNEESRIRPMLDAYTGFFTERYGRDVEFIIVVNGSRDRTAEIARTYGARIPQISVIEEADAIGKGGAVIMGFKHASGDCVGFADADGSTPPEAFDDLVVHIGDAGAIIASRWFPESVVEPRQTVRRQIFSRVFNFTINLLFRLGLSDTQCGAKVLRREALEEVLPDLGLTRWAFDVDLLFHIHRRGYRIIEWPTTWHDIGGSQLRLVRASFEMFIAIIRLRLLYSPFRWVVTLYDRTLGRITHGDG